MPIKSFVGEPEECATAHVEAQKPLACISWMNKSLWHAEPHISRSCASEDRSTKAAQKF